MFGTSAPELKDNTTMGQPTATIEVGSDGIAVITLQNPPVNALHPAGVLLFCLKHLMSASMAPIEI